MSGQEPRQRRPRSVSYIPFGSRKFSIRELSDHLPQISTVNGIAIDNHEIQPLESQVAGHQFDKDKKSLGMLKCKDGTVLKPVTKVERGLREIRFYEQLQTTTDPSLIALKKFCPNFYGTRVLRMHEKNVECLILDDVTEGMIEPCIADIKMGKVTWDLNAEQAKVAKEMQKYAACKEEVNFCIPGFQIHRLTTERLHKYNKDYGKKLNGTTVIDALRMFLNGDNNHILSRELIVKLLSILWEIQKWAREQKSIRLYSSSLLIAYDCKELKKIIEERSNKPIERKPSTSRKVSVDSRDGGRPCSTLRTIPSKNLIDYKQSSYTEFRKVGRSHSFHHNYNDYLSQVKKDYATTLRQLNDQSTNATSRPWCDIKIIDFAHAYISDYSTRDDNYLQAIDSLVKIFENFLETAE